MTMINLRRRVAVGVAGVAMTAAMTVALAPVTDAATYWGSIAYSANGSWGRAWDYPTKPAAESTAVTSCGYSDCKPLSSFTACGAVAKNPKRFQGGTGPTLSAAMSDALSRLPGSWIDTWACN